jgi:hypothetical protein
MSSQAPKYLGSVLPLGKVPAQSGDFVVIQVYTQTINNQLNVYCHRHSPLALRAADALSRDRGIVH